jgi:hypothetical protein
VKTHNDTQMIRMDQADMLVIANRFRANPYAKFKLVTPNGDPMFALISVQTLDIMERTFKRIIGGATKQSHDVVARESLRQLECLEAEEVQRLELQFGAHGAAKGA